MSDKNKGVSRDNRPVFPARAVVTGGMPYGNKTLHFGHVGGVFVFADVYARFLRDRIGKENVIFVSGTDCYGSPIAEGYRKACEAGFEGSIRDYVRRNHEAQKKTLEDYDISLDLFGASGLDDTAEVHNRVSEEVIRRLYELGHIKKLSTAQFYDEKAVAALATVPSREELLGKLLGSIQSPISNLARVINQIAEAKGGNGGSTEAAEPAAE